MRSRLACVWQKQQAAFSSSRLTPYLSAGIKVVIVFDATTSAQFEAQRESLSELVDIVFAAGGACVQFSSSHAPLAGGARNGL